MFTLDQIADIVSERACSVTDQIWVKLIWQDTLRSFLLRLVPQNKPLLDYSFFPVAYKQSNLNDLYYQGLEEDFVTKDI